MKLRTSCSLSLLPVPATLSLSTVHWGGWSSILCSYFSNTGPDIYNPPPALSPHSAELDTNCICLNNQPIYKIKSGCQIVFHWLRLFIPAWCMFIPQLRGGRSVKQYNRTRLSQPEGVAHPIKKRKKEKQNSAGSPGWWIAWVNFTKRFPAWQQTRIWGKQDFHVEGGRFSVMSSYF